MGLLYKPKDEQTISVEVEVLKDKRVVIEFYSDCGKFGTDEAIGGYVLTAERLLKILRAEQYSDDEL
jgi:hypothetical protein